MDHQEATRIGAPTRYMLGELSGSEKEAFEEHFFTCHECAEELQTSAMFAANARAVFKEQAASRPVLVSNVPPNRSWLDWFRMPQWLPAAAVAALLLCVVGYDRVVVIRDLKHQLAADHGPQPLLSFPLRLARGDEAFTIPKTQPFFAFYFNLPPNQASGYIAEIGGGPNSLTRTVPLPTPGAGDPFTILLRRSEFPSGSYMLRIRDEATHSEIVKYDIHLNTE
jgi:hypothetical protein